MKKILVCCVCYKNAQEVINYVNEVKKQTASDLIDIVITDNSHDDDEYQKLRMNLDEDVYLIRAFMNLGYIHGINYGLKKYLNNNPYPEWIVVSNTDLTYENNAFYEDLLNYYPDGYDCMIAPSIFSVQERKDQNPFVLKRYSKLKMFVLSKVFKYQFIERVFDFLHKRKQKLKNRKKETTSREIYSGHGACMILNKRYFLNGGDLNYGSFLFGEEIYISEMIRKNGGHIYYDNRLKVNHHEHTTISKEKRKKINSYYQESLDYLYKTFY